MWVSPYNAKSEHARLAPSGVMWRENNLAKFQLYAKHDFIVKFEMSSAAIAVFMRYDI